jgi:hypothetical protein
MIVMTTELAGYCAGWVMMGELVKERPPYIFFSELFLLVVMQLR